MNRYGLRRLLAVLFAGCLLAACASGALAEDVYCQTCGEGAQLDTDADVHVITCVNEACSQYGVASESYHTYAYDNIVVSPDDPSMHGYPCSECGYVSAFGSHYQACSNPGVCASCGTVYTGTSMSHSAGDAYEFNESYHWYNCTDCGEKLSVSNHTIRCADGTNLCYACGYDLSDAENVNYSHSWAGEYGSDETQHWYVCTDCGAAFGESEHVAECSNPGVCMDCDAAYTGSNVSHNYDWDNYVITDENHGYACLDCGNVGYIDEHSTRCNDLKACQFCGYESENIETIAHSVSSDMQYNENEHWTVCEDCGVMMVSNEHIASCTNPGVCSNCGYEDENMAQSHMIDYSNWQYDETQHWGICMDCGAESDWSEHYAECETPGVCSTCGAAYSGSNLIHNCDWDNPQSDATYHWYDCMDCGAEVSKYTHWAMCSEPGVCGSCGYEGSMNSGHGINQDEIQYSETHHWYLCVYCGTQISYDEHAKSCTSSEDVCAECGIAYTGSNINHNVNWEEQYQDETYHWYECLDCGAQEYKYTHWASCTTPGICRECGYEDADLSSSHSYMFDNIQYDETYHWYPCTDCGIELNKSEHAKLCTDGGDVCADCGIAYTGENITHQADWESDLQSDSEYHWYPCTLCGGRAEEGMHWDYEEPYGYCDYCSAEMGDMPPYIYLESQTVYLTTQGYGNASELYVYNEDALSPGALSAQSSDESVMTVELVYTQDRENLFRLTGHKAGEATLTVTAPNGLTDTMMLYVETAQSEIALPQNTTVVEAQAFEGAKNAEFIYIPDGVTEIGERAFADCTGLKRVYIPDSVTTIGEGAFDGCEDVWICTPEGSAALAYANENGIMSITD